MEDNIEYYYERLQENILIVEDDEKNKQALDAVTANFKGVFDYIKMFLITNKERYYGYFLMDMELRIDYFFDSEAGVNMDTLPFTLMVNPLLLGKYTIREMIFIICHEIEHIVLEHPAEAKTLNHNSDLWESVALNYAMDASVNDRLIMETNKYKLKLMSYPENGITSDFLSDEYGVSLDRLKDYLYYYDKIVTFETQIVENNEYEDEQTVSQSRSCEAKNTSVIPKNKKEDNAADSSDADGKSNSNDEQGDGNELLSVDDNLSLKEWLEKISGVSADPIAELGEDDENFWDETDELIGETKKPKKQNKSKVKERKESNKVIVVLGMPNCSRIITSKNRPPGLSLHKWTNMDLPDEIREQLRQYIQQVADGIPDEIRELFPSHQQEALDKALEKPSVKWDKVLRKYIGTISNGYKKTKTRLDRRQPERFDISGKISRRAIDIVVAIDTSGSMSKELLEKIFSEIFTILKTKEFHLTIIECDYEIRTVYEVRNMSDINFVVHGRGGTSFVPVIEYINENKKYRKSLLIYFTDGMGDEHIPKPQVYRMLWVIPCTNEGITNDFLKENENYLSVREPYGDVISMKVDPRLLFEQ